MTLWQHQNQWQSRHQVRTKRLNKAIRHNPARDLALTLVFTASILAMFL